MLVRFARQPAVRAGPRGARDAALPLEFGWQHLGIGFRGKYGGFSARLALPKRDQGSFSLCALAHGYAPADWGGLSGSNVHVLLQLTLNICPTRLKAGLQTFIEYFSQSAKRGIPNK